MCVVILIYICDAALLLYRNEVILIAKFRGRYDVKFGNSDLTFLGKILFIPNLFLPHQPLYRLSWEPCERTADVGDDEVLEATKQRLLGFAPYLWVMFVSLYVLLPVGLYIRHGLIVLLLSALWFYTMTIMTLILIYLERKTIGISNSRFTAICFESLICAPCALNITRKVSMAVAIQSEVAELSKKILTPLAYTNFIQSLLGVIDSQILIETEGSPRFVKLQAYRLSISRELV